MSPLGEAGFPEFGLLGGEGVGVDAFAVRGVFVDPWAEVAGGEVGEGKEEVGDVAFGIDDERRDVIHSGFFEHADAESGLTGTGHAENDAVGDEVARVVENKVVGGFVGGGIDFASEVERAEFFVVGGGGHDYLMTWKVRLLVEDFRLRA